MSFEVTTAFVQQYSDNLMARAQQHGSRLRGAVRTVTGTGTNYYFDYVGTVEAQTINDRHGDSPLNSTPMSRRRVDLRGYETGDLLDNIDKVQMLVDPTSAFIAAHGDAMGRKMDDVIIAALYADARTGVDGSGTASFTAGNIIAVNDWTYGSGTGDAGLTVSKLISARERLLAAEAISEGENLYLAVSQKQISDLLATTEATSADYNNVQALVRGQLNNFLGWNFLRTERLPLNGSSHRRVFGWAQSGMGLAVGKDIVSQVSQRPDKRFSWYAYFQMFIGATRLEEEKVIEIVCDE